MDTSLDMSGDTPLKTDEGDPVTRGMPGWKKALLVLSTLVLVIVAGITGGGYYLYQRYDSKVARATLLPPVAPQEAAQSAENWKSGAVNLLLLGSDSRAAEAGGDSPAGERSDTIMLVHIAKGRDKAAIISIPRDSYVNVPAGGSWKGGKNKINAAFAFGGAELTATTVRQLTGVVLDGAMIADFASIRNLVDSVDGVEVCVPYDVVSTFSDKVWKQGCHELDGDTAEEFMRQRYQVPGGDFGRMYNQQLVVKAVVAKVSSSGAMTDPLALDGLIGIAADSLTVDQNLDLRDLAFAVRGIRPAAISYATVPYTSASLKTSAGTAVRLDPKKSAAMFAAVKDDTIDQWLAANPSKTPGS
ncbi:LCP family protein [Actinoplanes derwentensis]|uniref:Cell envelope-related function transcriptional attenuator common domain-containing protein n=1 Tax=Actinoplanes derwentensis TaxID=113562 RepID=A0A1H1PXJ0_9ACTN|nr:LCP family protein [Actinoplanes derwentensis]GID82306.1 LytTR family transcriptional regulator [Actinoplanes derwentensis]SDS15717.1 cell envelope-related function transcriptional attenuator common domain-containing protein [Actinoplanes derwentensis]